MFCSNCGKENSNDSKFCFNCGSPMVNKITSVINVPSEGKDLVSSVRVECPACQSINSLEEDGSEKSATSVSLFRVGGILMNLIGVATIVFSFFTNDKIDRFSMMAMGAVLVWCGVRLIKTADTLKGYSCRACNASMLMDVSGAFHNISKSSKPVNKSSKSLLIGAVIVGLIVLGFGFTSTLNQTSHDAGLTSQNIEYAGFKLGMSRNDVIQANSNFKTIKGGNGVDYYVYGKNPQIMVHFDSKSLKVRQIGCWANVDKKFPSNSCLINGIKVGDTKEMVLNMLGDPDRVLLNSNGTKSFLYKNINLEFGIFEGRVFEVYLIDQKSHDSIQYELKNAPNVIPLY